MHVAAYCFGGLASNANTLPLKRRSLWFTKYKENELRASSIYNGVDLTEPVVDFTAFSTDEALDEDVVIWVNAGFIHVPGNEDIPHTPNTGSQVGLILRPQNFFPQTPDGPTNAGYVFTTDMEEWINGYVESPHPDCELTNASVVNVAN
ncbi:Amiloride-sensitive amine oxidase copper-containing [Taenia crassiceps]|uniref:Amine oxidase n=1 Tax=Taenia crassiceps TaxID=6207 RepID=A0ABR4QC64_9CEST